MSQAAPRRPAHASSRRHAGLGTARLFWAFVIVLGCKMLFDLGEAASAAPDERATLRLTMWAVLVLCDVAIVVVTRLLGGHLPGWLAGMLVLALGLVELMDLVSVAGSPDPGRALTAGTSAGMSLLLTVPTRPAREIAAALTGLIALLLTGLMLAGGFSTGPAMSPAAPADSAFALCQVAGVIIAATLIAHELRSLVRRALEQTLSHSALTASRPTAGGERSDQLARLDLSAESLLDAVADGRAPLPLSPEIAQRAARLATQLRRHLLETRSRTWLDLAVGESEILSASILVEDPASGAGLLSTRQRGALLSALWLLTEQRRRRGSASEPGRVTIATPEPEESEGRAVLPITVTIPWSSRSRVDPGVWEHLAQVGRYVESRLGRGLAVRIDGLVAAAEPIGGARDRNGGAPSAQPGPTEAEGKAHR